VFELQEPVSEAEVIHDLHDGGIDRVSTKIALEILVSLQEGDIDVVPREDVRQHNSSGASADDAARSLLHFLHFILAAPSGTDAMVTIKHHRTSEVGRSPHRSFSALRSAASGCLTTPRRGGLAVNTLGTADSGHVRYVVSFVCA
jgi:hypothetical protein